MLRIVSIVAIFYFSISAFGTMGGYEDPENVKQRCPVIVVGTIVEVEKRNPNDKDSVSTAVIEISEVVKNVLSDVPLIKGSRLTVRMQGSIRFAGESSRDYPVKTKALWLISMNEREEFQISESPSQKLPIHFKLNYPTIHPLSATSAEYNLPPVPVTKKAWAQRMKGKTKDEQLTAQKELTAMSAQLMNAPKIDAQSMKAFTGWSIERRCDFLEFTPFIQALKGVRQGEVIAWVLAHDPDETVRAAAAERLPHHQPPLADFVTASLVKAMSDRASRVRFSACIALFRHRAKDEVASIRPLLKDPDRDVRLVAARVLGQFEDKPSTPTIADLFEREKADDLSNYSLAESLAYLGEKKVALKASRRAVRGDNPIVIRLTHDVIRKIDPKQLVVIAVENLERELDRILKSEPGAAYNNARYTNLCRYLGEWTGRKNDFDPIFILDWWEKTRGEYDAPAIVVDRDAVRKSYEIYLRKLRDESKQ